MNTGIPAIDQFTVQAVDQIRFSGVNEELKYSVEIIPQSITNRVLVAIMDQRLLTGMAVAIYPATGEVCDVANGGGVIGYLSHAPLNPSSPLHCELSIFRFGRNFVCSVVIAGETFLYPAFSCEISEPMAALVGKERHNGDSHFNWNHLSVELQELNGVIAA
ncbi:MAG: hypothetical protein P1V20_23600 [Verrucomicrobiales bacterium]|nr:hypothetical protein [Verrucomicrobiales bacterium]